MKQKNRSAFSSMASFFLVLALLCPNLLADQTVARSFKTNTPPLSDVRQLLVVTTKDWATVSGQMLRFERPNETSIWRQVEAAFPVVVGRNGLGWGQGLTLVQNVKSPWKKEGDGKSPAGIFRLSSAFGLAEPETTAWLKLPYQTLLSTLECVDDAQSIHYNAILDKNKILQPDWNSSEKMREIGEQYRWGVVVDHNVNPRVPGGGSCIFLHIWKNAETGTSGCTAMTMENMERLLHWLDAAQQPALVQLPEAEYKLRQKEWHLPDLTGRPHGKPNADRQPH